MPNPRTKIVFGGIILVFVLNCLCLAMIASTTISGVASYGASWLTLNQYAQSTNAYIENTERTCEKRPPARRGKSHKKPEVAKWTPTNAR